MILSDLSARLGCRLDGSPDLEILGVASLEDATAQHVALCAGARFVAALAGTRAGAVIVPLDGPMPPCAALRSPQPYLAFARALAIFAPPTGAPSGVHPRAVVAPSAVIGPEVAIGACAVIGERVRIGRGTTIYPNVTIGDDTVIGDGCTVHANVSVRERVVIGDRVLLHDGVVVGADGFGFVPRADGTYEKIPQTAAIVIEDDVEIGANTTVDRPPLGETRIGAGTKIDNLVQVAHGSRIGRNVVLAAQVGMAGSVVIEEGVVAGGRVGIADHVTVGRNARLSGGTVVSKDVEPGAHLAGYPGIPVSQWRRASVLFRHLPTLTRRLDALEARLAALLAKEPS
ncbi:MAG: UDP-3-O-(3-hydroxymyristoyl)glucosamine N-acyltransferase [Vicinamibacterales bacterium]|nr:UDP-3-O-(3-hydroxymyristoyl)glucosamine N-acyltransferase [Vicinamibacterales bacterium]